MLSDSKPRFVGPSVGPSVHRSVRWSVTLYFFWVFAVFGLTAPAQMWSDLNYGPCPPARDWDSRVSDLVFFIIDKVIWWSPDIGMTLNEHLLEDGGIEVFRLARYV